MPVWVFLTFLLKFQEAKGVERTPQEWSALLFISCQGELGINMMLFTFIACVTCQVSPLKMYCFFLSLLCSLKMSYWVYPTLTGGRSEWLGSGRWNYAPCPGVRAVFRINLYEWFVVSLLWFIYLCHHLYQDRLMYIVWFRLYFNALLFTLLLRLF